jgi:hypothetical protein
MPRKPASESLWAAFIALMRRQEGSSCIALVVPAHGDGTGRPHGAGRECRRGFLLSRSHGDWVPVDVPENAYLTERGDPWDCNRGVVRRDAASIAIAAPDNAQPRRQHLIQVLRSSDVSAFRKVRPDRPAPGRTCRRARSPDEDQDFLRSAEDRGWT